MNLTTKALLGAATGATFALSGIVAAVPATAAPAVASSDVAVTAINAPATLDVTAEYAAKAITLTTTQPMKDGSYAVALGYMTADDSVVAGRLVEIENGKAKGEGAKLGKDGKLTLTFKLNEFRKFPKTGGMPGGKDHGLKAFPKPTEAQYTLSVFEGTTLTPYQTTITFK